MMGKKVKILFAAVCIIVLCICTFMMAADDYWFIDEVVTYSMANSNYDGWMFSRGRVGEYITNEIIADNFIDTGKNFVGFVLDLVKNFKNADYFSYPRPDETGWYTGEEASDWFRVTSDERFDYASVYVNAMSDESNSFFYYSLVHTVGSIFMSISNTSWAAFIVNAVALVLVMVLIFKIALKMGCSESIALLTMLCYGISGSCIIQVTTLRAYVVASVFHLALFLLHLQLYSAAEHNDKKNFKNTCILLLIVYVIGYFAHYTILFSAAFLGINTVIKFARTNEIRTERFIQKYILAGAAAIILGVVMDPVSVMGLVLKFFHDQSGTENITSGLGAVLYRSMVQYVTVNTAGLVIIGVTFTAALIVILRKKQKSKSDKLILYLGSILLEEGLILLIVTRQAYYRPLYPLFFLVMVYVYAEAIKQINRGLKYVPYIALLVVLIYGICSFSEIYTGKKEEGVALWALEDVLNENKTDKMIFIRGPKSGYDFAPLLQNYSETLTVTIPNSTWEGFENTAQFQETLEFTVVSTDESDESLLRWLSSNGFGNQELLYWDDTYQVYYVRRR